MTYFSYIKSHIPLQTGHLLPIYLYCSSLTYEKMMHTPSESTSLTSFMVLLLFILPTQAINRTVGPPHDPHFVNATNSCNGSDPANFRFDECSKLISCVYEHLHEGFKASMSCGASIAALLPTILVLIGELSFLGCSSPGFSLQLSKYHS